MPRVGLLVLGLLSALTQVALADEFPAARDTQAVSSPILTPQQALAALRLPKGFHATLFAAEPEVRQPIGMTFDPRGRMWVAENYTYAELPKRFEPDQRDRIIVLEDRDGDGMSDHRTIFWDRGQQLTSVEVGFGGVWAMCPPQLLFIPDADHNLVPDGEPVVVLDGFDTGPGYTHNFANGLKWGPDGWLYGRVGITAPGLVGAPGTSPDQRTPVGPSFWRYHPVTRAFEEVCSGTTNPWGHDWNEHGELVFINTVIGHLWHALPGAHYRRMFGADRNPFVYQVIEQTADHFHWDTSEAWNEAKKGVSSGTDQAGGGHAHSGMLIYQGGNWPAQFHGQVLALNMHGRRVNVDRLERTGATYVGRHEPDLIFSDDVWFRGVEVISGPEGAVYIADWSDIGECHENDGVHRTTGRIFRITYGDVPPQPAADLTQLSSLELVALLPHRNVWMARQAQQLLQERAVAGALPAEVVSALRQLMTNDGDLVHRLRAIWTLAVTQQLSPEDRLALLSADDEHLRVWGVRLITDAGDRGQPVARKLTSLAQTDPSGLVLCYLASGLQKWPAELGQPVAAALLMRTEFADDRVYPLLLWHGIERMMARDLEGALPWASSARIPLLRQFIARRVTQELKHQPAAFEQLIQQLVIPGTETEGDLLTGISQGLQGWRKVTPPSNWLAAQSRLSSSSDARIRQLTNEIAVVFGDGRAMDDLRKIAMAGDADLGSRRAALAALVESRGDQLPGLLKSLMSDRDLAPEAIRGLASISDDATASLIVNQYSRMPPAARLAAVETLSARPNFAQQMLAGIRNQQIPRSEVPVHLVRQIQRFSQNELNEQIAALWPELRSISEDKKARISTIRSRLSEDMLAKADRVRGRALWDQSCGKCHQLFGEGGRIGPDLTGAQRHNLDYLLENVVDPSATLAPQFRMTTILLDDGRVVSGVVLTRTEAAWEVQTPTEKVTVRVPEIEESRETTQSLMPEGLLDLLPPDDVAALIAYVSSPRQVARAAAD